MPPARIVEVVSGMTFDAFLQKRLFDPLGMKDTTFYPTDAQRARLRDRLREEQGHRRARTRAAACRLTGTRDRPPQGNGGLYSTAPDYARFCQMLLNGGTLDGRRYLSADAMKFLGTPQTGDLPTGFFQNDTYGNRGANYGWGIGTCDPAHAARRRGRDALARHLSATAARGARRRGSIR